MSTSTATPAFVTQQPPPPPPPSSVHFISFSSFSICVIVALSAYIILPSIYRLVRFLSARFRRTSAAPDHAVSSDQQRYAPPRNGLLDRLPLFAFGSVTGNLTGDDCALCLSKFEPRDQLRLLPLCCHAFHAACIDTWIVANQTCPLCRSAVLPSDAEVLDKTFPLNRNRPPIESSRNEIGSISRRLDVAADGEQRSNSIPSDEVPAGSTDRHRGEIPDADKESFVGIPMPEAPGEVHAAEVSGERNWMRDYVDRLTFVPMSSRAMSFRSSGRISGSSRRSEVVIAAEDLEASRAGEEISEMFRWLSA